MINVSLERLNEIRQQQILTLRTHISNLHNALESLPCGMEEFVGTEEVREYRYNMLELERLNAEIEGKLDTYVPDPDICPTCGAFADEHNEDEPCEN